jgi:murein L,D-transpeptidase YcbB/YkuD
MDKFKMLPDTMPARYIWINITTNNLEIIENGEVVLVSKIITGKPDTRTPVLTSEIEEVITYPQWVPPLSIILKDILPGVKRNPGYLARRGFKMVTSKGKRIDPYKINWTKYTDRMPYKVVQDSGNDNALGVMKFNFKNKYSVYLHDTNQRYLFANGKRFLSHGCVRVQEWNKLADYLLKDDSLVAAEGKIAKLDSMKIWLEEKEKMVIPVTNRLPVFIRYFTCEGKDGRIVFYDDIYGDDKLIREKYFASK